MVSIITNCYNGEKYLEETIQSVLNQTYTDWEYLLFDNCSSDRSAEIFLSHKDPRLKYFKNDKTVPLGYGRFLAERMVTGDYVCFIDSDDLWLPENLEKQVAVMEMDPEVGLVYSDYAFFGVNNTVRKTSDEGYRTTAMITSFYDLGLSSTMFRRSVLHTNNIQINKEYNLIADYDLFVRISRVSKCYHIKKNLAKYRTHSANLTHTVKSGAFEYNDIYEKFLKDFTKEEIRENKVGIRKLRDNYWEHKFNENYGKKNYLSALYCLFHIRNYKRILVIVRTILKNAIV